MNFTKHVINQYGLETRQTERNGWTVDHVTKAESLFSEILLLQSIC